MSLLILRAYLAARIARNGLIRIVSAITTRPGERGVTELDPKTGKTTRRFVVRDGRKKPD